MNAITEQSFLENDEFHAPSTDDFVDGLIDQHKKSKQQIQEVASIMRGERGNAIHYFITANADRNFSTGKGGLFDEDPAIKALDAAYWSKAIHHTKLLDLMPQKRRSEWHEQIDKRQCPPFEESTVRATLADLLGKRNTFFAERVDGIFRNLSGEHVTNSPSGFGKRFIMGYMLESWGTLNHQRFGYVNDLRCVIARFMGREEPSYDASEGLGRALKSNFGEWVWVDGNAFKIRLYKKGTVHIDVHPDMAWRLNATLAHLYPSAIPPEFRTKPKSKPKDIVLMQTPLPMAVISMLSDLTHGWIDQIDEKKHWNDRIKKVSVPNSVRAKTWDRHVGDAAAKVLQSIGGLQDTEHQKLWRFDYDPMPVIHQIVASGLVPDDKSHQYYPTPESVASYAIEQAEISDEHKVLEPSAGIGNLADLMPNRCKVACVEVSELRATILQNKDYTVHCADFLKWAETQPHQSYDRIVMNPPFDRGQWKAHVEHALPLLKRGGRLVAILPESANGKYYPDGCASTYPMTFDNEFNHTSITVAILVANKVT
jgi:hypothetical protein